MVIGIKPIIFLDFDEFSNFFTDNLNNMLKQIVERDNKCRKEQLEENKKND